MCHDPDSSPPIDAPRGSASGTSITLRAADGNQFAAFSAEGENPEGPAVVVLPDVRGLYPFYEELTLRLADKGFDSVAIDYFGRTAGVGERDDEFPYMEHIPLTTIEGVTSDVKAAVTYLRNDKPERKIFTLGFCFGGSNSWLQAAAGHGLAGAIGFYGNPMRPPSGPMDQVDRFECPILALMGGEDPGIPELVISAFRERMDEMGVVNEVVVYAGAPHSFFDRKQAVFADEAADAWKRVLAFIRKFG